jgi:hypothetical protein
MQALAEQALMNCIRCNKPADSGYILAGLLFLVSAEIKHRKAGWKGFLDRKDAMPTV